MPLSSVVRATMRWNCDSNLTLLEVSMSDQSNTTSEASQCEEPLVQESLVEEVSIDGMCGVY